MANSVLRLRCTLLLRLRLSARPLPEPSDNIGPLNGLRLRFANIIPGEGGGKVENAADDSVLMANGLRRTPAGKLPFVGVAGRTLTEVCGLRATLTEPVVGLASEADADDVEEAFECVW
jgi:hypothetical protein